MNDHQHSGMSERICPALGCIWGGNPGDLCPLHGEPVVAYEITALRVQQPGPLLTAMIRKEE